MSSVNQVMARSPDGQSAATGHELLVWTPQMVKAFWDYESNFPRQFFTRTRGYQIIRAISQYLPRNCAVLDYGCGPGNLIGPLLHMLGDISTQARDAIIQADWSSLGDLMNIHQGILDAFGVNTPQLANLIFAAREAGAPGAKLSGAGGGDCMFALAPAETRQAVESAVTEAGGLVVQIPSGAPGVRLEN